jgi:hypothetical protein
MGFEELGSMGWVLKQVYWKGEGCHLPAFLDLPLLKCACQEHIINMRNNMGDPLEALWQSE